MVNRRKTAAAVIDIYAEKTLLTAYRSKTVFEIQCLPGPSEELENVCKLRFEIQQLKAKLGKGAVSACLVQAKSG